MMSRQLFGRALGNSPAGAMMENRFKLYDPTDVGDESPPPQRAEGVPSPDMTLLEFFDEWFLPVVLVAQRDVSQATITLYRDALGYWQALTGDPPLSEIDDRLCAAFVGQLRSEATYKRGNLGTERALSSSSIAKHLKNLRSILYRTGPRLDPQRPTVEVLTRLPFLPNVRAEFTQKPSLTIETARQIAAAATELDKPDLPKPLTAAAWWKVRLALLYYTGLRSGTIVDVAWKHFERTGDKAWLNVPAGLVRKTSKPIRLALHPQAVELIEQLPTPRPPDERIVPLACCYRYFLTLHEQAQQRAGLPAEQWHSPHVWRRTHGQQMADLGAERAIEVARIALDHSDGRTTEAHYVSVVNQLRVRLPPLF
jgi:integrase